MNHNLHPTNENLPDEYNELSGNDAGLVDLIVHRTGGAVERGWMVLGTGNRGGIPYVRVGKIREDGRRETKNIATELLDAWQNVDQSGNQQEVGIHSPPERERAVGDLAVSVVLDSSLDSVDAPKQSRQAMDMDDARLERFSARIQELATPLETNLDGSLRRRIESDVNPYSNIWNEMDDDDEPVDIAKAAIRRSDRETVKPQMIEDAIRTISGAMQVDDQLSAILMASGLDTLDPRGVVEKVREDHILRCELITYFQKKLDDIRYTDPLSLPERVRRDAANNQKSPNSDGYSVDKMSSSEYVSVLALSKLDGSFDASRADTTRSHTNTDGTPGYGQHRTAADRLLT